MWIAVNHNIKRDRTLVRIVLTRQTAGAIAGPTASATAAAILNLLGDNAQSNRAYIMSKVVTHELNHLLRISFGFVQPEQRLSTQHGKRETIEADAFGDLLQVKFDTRLFIIGQIWVRL